jgi:hypothetical protein
VSRYSKYNEISQKQVGRLKRTIKAAGSGDDDGIYYYCWNCGAQNSINENPPSSGPENISYTFSQMPNMVTYDTMDSTPNDYSGISATSLNIGTSGKCVLLNTNPDFVEFHQIVATPNSGCWFCGCPQYR